jgi:hypothetical protein
MTVYNSYQYYPLISDINYIFNFLLKMLKLKRVLKKGYLFMVIIIKWQVFTVWRCGYIFFFQKFLYVFSWILHKEVTVESYRYFLYEIWYTHLLIFVIKACGMFSRCIRHRDKCINACVYQINCKIHWWNPEEHRISTH